MTGDEIGYMSLAMKNGHISGDGDYTKKAQLILEQHFQSQTKVLVTTSCTHALEIAAILLKLQPEDEVIFPSYTFVSTALAFVMHGATPVFTDIRPDTLNIDETKISGLITDKTRAIVVVHYAGVSCEMDVIMAIATKNNLLVIEDNAHGLYGQYKNRKLGTIGHLATQSFHETKNISCGEGGALVINDDQFLERAEIIREKGTNRASFFRGHVDKYSWVDKGSSYIMSDLLAAYLTAQLLHAEDIQKQRRLIWYEYYHGLESWAKKIGASLPVVPYEYTQAYHMFYLLMPDSKVRTQFLKYLNENGIQAVFHYIPLHSSRMGMESVRGGRDCPVSEAISKRIVRLPFFFDLTPEQQEYAIEKIILFGT